MFRFRPFLLPPSALVALLAAPTLHAADGRLVDMDRDRNGEVTSAEHETAARDLFDRIDDDDDGRLSAAEMAEHLGAQGKARPTEIAGARRIAWQDANGDGVLSVDEYTVGARDRFLRMDVNDDDRVTAAEWANQEAREIGLRVASEDEDYE